MSNIRMNSYWTSYCKYHWINSTYSAHGNWKIRLCHLNQQFAILPTAVLTFDAQHEAWCLKTYTLVMCPVAIIYANMCIVCLQSYYLHYWCVDSYQAPCIGIAADSNVHTSMLSHREILSSFLPHSFLIDNAVTHFLFSSKALFCLEQNKTSKLLNNLLVTLLTYNLPNVNNHVTA